MGKILLVVEDFFLFNVEDFTAALLWNLSILK